MPVSDKLCPIWRCVPNMNGVGALAFDPLDAEVFISRGWVVLDGHRYGVTLDGWDGTVDLDGRVSVRITKCG